MDGTCERRHYRSMDQLLDDCITPSNPLCETGDRRKDAINEVLRCLPPEDYHAFSEQDGSFQWFIPEYDQLGRVQPFWMTHEAEPVGDGGGWSYKPYARVIWLSQRLERRAEDIVLAVVAHEIAHIVLDHKVRTDGDDLYEAQEKEAWAKVAAWGFGRQAKKHEALSKWGQSFEKAMLRRCLQKERTT